MQIPSGLMELGFSKEKFDCRFKSLSTNVYKECLRIYIKENLIAKLVKAAEAEIWVDCYDYAVALKGSSGNLALMKQYELYSDIIDNIPTERKQLVKEYINQAVRLEAALRTATYGFLYKKNT